MISSCDLKVTLCLGGGESRAFGLKGEARRDGGLELGLEEGVMMVGVGVLEGYLASGMLNEANRLLSFDIQAGQPWMERSR